MTAWSEKAHHSCSITLFSPQHRRLQKTRNGMLLDASCTSMSGLVGVVGSTLQSYATKSAQRRNIPAVVLSGNEPQTTLFHTRFDAKVRAETNFRCLKFVVKFRTPLRLTRGRHRSPLYRNQALEAAICTGLSLAEHTL